MIGSIPLFVRKFIVDFVEGAVAALITVNYTFPHDVAQAQQMAFVIAVAIASAVVPAIRRSDFAAGFMSWLKAKLQIT